ncbi:hypothetical protein [Actinomadura syzygii]|uniref:Uncharacterized protein n=1 Tax=Actinomadura syzygii TaxID=1427538 RepID=A0A5D0UDG0_9ACTN|nr:hypothetical protein FXF65_10835 [Actinomadura syzygii]
MWQVNTSMAVLRNTVTDADGDKSTLSFEVWTLDADGKPKDRVKLTDDNPYGVLVSDFVASGKTASVTVDTGRLKPGVTYVFRTSAFDGSLYETSWSPWAKFKIRNRVVDIKLPAPKQDEPTLDQDAFQQPQKIAQPVETSDHGVAVRPGTQGRNGRAGSSCADILKRADGQICWRIVPDDGKRAPKKRSKTSAASPDLVDWCDDNPAGSYIKRYEACINLGVVAEAVKVIDNKPVTLYAKWNVQQQYQLSNNTGDIREKMSLVPTDPVDPFFAVTLDVDFKCLVFCTSGSGSPEWDGLRLWLPGDLHTAEGTTSHTWEGGKEEGERSPFINLEPTITQTRETGNQEKRSWMAVEAAIRCDTLSKPQPGCVFPGYTPTWTFNTKKFPVAAAHAWLIKSKLPNHPGSREHGKPMFFLPKPKPDDTTGRDPDDNRKVICPSGWARKNGHPETTPVKDGDVPSCDEFAFAASYNSGGMPTSDGGLNQVSSGDQCLQTYGTRIGADDWHLYDDERKPAPTFTEVCGRSAMSNWMNTQSMQSFASTFSQKYRLLNYDKYWVSTPGFEHCDATVATVRCTVPKP